MLLWFFMGLATACAEEDWRVYARRLSGEAKHVRSEMIEALKAVPNLDGYLRVAFQGPERYLAYDVLSALEKREFLDEVLKLIPTDSSGFAVHAANSLSTAEQRMKLIEAYRKHLDDAKTSAPARMAMFDTLGRLGAQLSEETCQQSLEHESFDVRAAALLYLRQAVLRQGRRDWTSRVAPALDTAQPWQIRAQALFLLSELAPKERRGLVRKYLPAACEGIPKSEPERICHSLSRQEHGR